MLTTLRYHCLFCDGYEERGQKTVGVLALGAIASAQTGLLVARMAHRLSQSVTVYTDGNQILETEMKDAAPGSEPWLQFDSRPIARFQKGEVAATVIVHFKDQPETKEEGFLVDILCLTVLIRGSITDYAFVGP